MDYRNIIMQMGLELLTEDARGFNFRCPICGDSKTHATKTRGWLYSNKKYKFVCYNGCPSLTFEDFVTIHFNHLVSELGDSAQSKINSFKNRINIKDKEAEIVEEKELIEQKFINPQLYNIKIFDNMKEEVFPKLTAPYLEYCNNRLLPQTLIDGLKYCNLEFSQQYPFGKMLIFPFYAKGDVYGFQGRRIEEKRFYIYSQDDFKIYNVFNVDINENVFIFEGIIDSSYKKNSIAMLGSSLSSALNNDIKNKVFAFDNDITGAIKSLEKIKMGEKIFIWPSSLDSFKDVNEFVCAEKITSKNYYQIEDLFNQNIYQGIEATVKMKMKCINRKWDISKPKFIKKEYDKFTYFKKRNLHLFTTEQEENPDIMPD